MGLASPPAGWTRRSRMAVWASLSRSAAGSPTSAVRSTSCQQRGKGRRLRSLSSNDTSSRNSALTDTDITVMVVDDHPLWTDAVSRDLGSAGFSVVATAADGDEAVRRALATRPLVVLMDLQL